MLDSTTSFDLGDREVHAAVFEADLLTLQATPPLDLCWDLLCDVQTFQVSTIWQKGGGCLCLSDSGIVWNSDPFDLFPGSIMLAVLDYVIRSLW